MHSHDHNLSIYCTNDYRWHVGTIDVGLAADTQSLANVSYLQTLTFIATVLLCTRWEEGKGKRSQGKLHAGYD